MHVMWTLERLGQKGGVEGAWEKAMCRAWETPMAKQDRSEALEGTRKN